MNCLYCGITNNSKSEEHIICEKLGCYETIRDVCKSCNSGVLSTLDTAIIDFSPLSLVNDFRKANAEPSYYWASNEINPNLLLEAFANLAAGTFTLYPQLVLIEGKLELHGDAEEMQSYGQERLADLFLKKANESLSNSTSTRFHNQQVDMGILDSTVFYPPRCFAKSIEALESGERLYMRFSGEDNKALMDAIEKRKVKSFSNFEERRASSNAKFCLIYRPDLIQRALLKFALNTLTYVTKNTKVSNQTFGNTARIITNFSKITKRVASKHRAAMVRPETIGSFANQGARHSVRLSYSYNFWQCSFSFFQGNAAALVTFPGINDEPWRTVDIHFPQENNKPELDYYSGGILASGCPTWNLAELIPSSPIVNISSVSLGTKRWKGLRI